MVLSAHTRNLRTLPLAVLAAVLMLGTSGGAFAQSTSTPPNWEQLTPAQRDTLVAPLRERWNNASPQQRQHMLQRAERWKSLPPDQRQRAEHGMRRWDNMPPQQQREMRALYQHMQTLTPEQRNAMRERWRAMTPQQRQAWVEANPPKRD